jgi:prepilin-type N-terminal cleavage/methylation domain-containing protein
MHHHRGFTLVELITVIAASTALAAMLAVSGASNLATARLQKEGVQLATIHQAWVSWDEFDGALPLPGLVRRKVEPEAGRLVPGRGPEDPSRNTHANLYSVCIMQHYFSPQTCVGTTEVNPKVVVKEDYNWERYQPALNAYWDPSFVASLESNRSHVSYATMPLCGQRKAEKWRTAGDPGYPMVANRGPRGDDDLQQHILNMKESLTVKLHGGHREWVGQVCFGDNHTEVFKSLLPHGLTYPDPRDPNTAHPDNLFNNDIGDNTGSGICTGIDTFLVLCWQMQVSGEVTTPVLAWD